MNANEAVNRAREAKTVIPAFNIPFLPMVKPVIAAIVDEKSIAMIQVARLEWEKFQSQSLEAVAEEYNKYAKPDFTLLHLDHIPVIDEDNRTVDYMPVMERAIKVGYQSVMLDGSRLPLDGNIEATKRVSELAHSCGVAVEAELGCVSGHESGGIGMSYEELFRTKKGFTDILEAKRFAAQSGCDWLSVAVGSVHGAIAENTRKDKKPEALLDITHIAALREAVGGMPMVLHGGSGIKQQYILNAIENGISKINVGTEIRQSYELAIEEKGGDIEYARHQVYQRTRWVISEFLKTSGSQKKLYG